MTESVPSTMLIYARRLVENGAALSTLRALSAGAEGTSAWLQPLAPSQAQYGTPE